MKNDERKLTIAVVASQVSDIQQRQLLEGIIEQAHIMDINVAVFSNVYNPFYSDKEVEIENNIYNLIYTEKVDGIIVDEEPILNEELKSKISELLAKRKDIPIVSVCLEHEGYDLVNNDVLTDFEKITDHLIEVHSFTDIDMLTGFDSLETSHLRKEGYKKSLEAHGLKFDESHVIYGDYWMYSGESLAKDYVYGKRKLPQAIICGNDFMAFGLCDEFMKHGIKVPEDVSIVGYEYVGERYLHSPIISTYQRNRKAIGINAVRRIYNQVMNDNREMIPMDGFFIAGNSCTCGADDTYLRQELEHRRDEEFYNRLNLMGTLGLKLTLCTSIDEYIGILRQYSYLIRNMTAIYLCLYDDWCDSELTKYSSKTTSETMICYPVVYIGRELHDAVFFNKKELFPDEIIPDEDKPYLMYYVPLFFAGKEFGYLTLKYDINTNFDLIFISWLKTASNALEFLRMKNDINYLVKCQNLSKYHDTTTGLFNEQGIEKQLKIKLANSSPTDKVVMLMLKTSLFSKEFNFNRHEKSMSIEMEISDLLKRLTAEKNELCAKIDSNTYLLVGIGEYNEESCKLLNDMFVTLITHLPNYIEECGLSSFVNMTAMADAEFFSFNKEIEKLKEKINKEIYELTLKHQQPNFKNYMALRNELYANPENEWDVNQVCQRFCLSTGHFRVVYRELFGISFHQDTIQSKLLYAKHMLLTTSMSVSAIAMKCGYEDEKYFMRQFRQLTSYTPNQYRNNYGV